MYMRFINELKCFYIYEFTAQGQHVYETLPMPVHAKSCHRQTKYIGMIQRMVYP